MSGVGLVRVGIRDYGLRITDYGLGIRVVEFVRVCD